MLGTLFLFIIVLLIHILIFYIEVCRWLIQRITDTSSTWSSWVKVMMKRKSKTKDSKKSILKKKVRRDHPDILLQKALRGKGDFTTWPVHSTSDINNSLKGKKVDIVKSRKANQRKIQNTKRLTELGRVNKSNDYQT